MERGSLRWVSNLLKVRWFLVLGVVQLLEDQLDKLLEATNRVVRAFGQPGLYVNDGNSKHRFHISIGWTNMDQSKKAEKTEDEERLQELVFRPKEVALPRCDCVKVKIGNVIHSIGLVSRRQAASTLLG